MAHAQYVAFLVPAGTAAPQFRCLSMIAPPDRVPLVSSTLSMVIYASLSPPGFSSGRSICLKESFLRI
jgi:hypothetical protein